MSHLDSRIVSEDESNDEMDECKRDLTKDLNGGLLKQIVQGGKYKSKPEENDDVLIHVIGTLKNENKVFYNTRKLEKPLETKLNSPDLPDAIRIGVKTMKINEIAVFTCKPDYAYKDVGRKQDDFIREVPPNSTIVFEIELLDFRFNDCTKHKDGGVMLTRILEKSDQICNLNFGSEVCADIHAFKKDMDYKDEGNSFFHGLIDSSTTRLIIGDINQVMDLTNFKWIMGEGSSEEEHPIPKGVEIAVGCMNLNMRAMFTIRYDYLREIFTDEEYEKHKKANQVFYFTIKLRSCKTAKEYYELTSEERFQSAIKYKSKGNHFMQRQNPKLAIKNFKHAIDLLECSIDLDGEIEERSELLFICLLNITKAYFDAGIPERAECHIKRAIEMKPDNEKALYRFGQYLMKHKIYDEAKNQFRKLLKIYPANKAAQKLATECDSKMMKQNDEERILYKSMMKLN